MAVYTFYMCNADGSSNTLEAFALGSEELAAGCAGRMLDQHPSCAYVAVFEGERPVLTRHRGLARAGVSLDRAYGGG